jgi:hypothetical protein
MTYRVLLAAIFALSLSACGGGSGDGGKGGSSAQGTSAMAGAFSTELTKVQECVQGEVDGKGPCTVDYLLNPVTSMCSDVRTGRPNTSFTGADYAKFTATCDNWKSVLGDDNPTKVTQIGQMVTDLKALQ